jgi:hypothetical protein
MIFLRSVANYRRIHKRKRSIYIRQELKTFNLEEEVENTSRIIWHIFYECQLIEFLGRYSTIFLKEQEREVGHLRDGSTSSSNPKIGTSQKA